MKKLFSLVLILTMLISLIIPVAFANERNMTIAVESITTAPGQLVSIPIMISNNGTNITGIGAINNLRVSFDGSMLEWDTDNPFTNGILLDFAVPHGRNMSDSYAIINFDSLWGTSENGTLITLRFKIKDGIVSGDIPVSLSVGSIAEDINLTTIPPADYNLMNGTISVIRDYEARQEPIPNPNQLSDTFENPNTTITGDVLGLDDIANIPSTWAVKAVEEAQKLSLIPNGLYGNWRRNLNRAEFAAIAVSLYEHLDGKAITARGSFEDTTDVNVLKLRGLGIVQGDAGKYDPNGDFTREMSITLMYNMMVQLGYEFEDAEPVFTDAEKITSWAREAVGALQKAGIVQGDGVSFNPQQIFTREMGVMTMMNFLEHLK